VSTDRIYLLVAFLAGAVTYTLLTSGCTTIDHRSAPVDWPKLEEKILYVNGATLYKYCKSNLLTNFAFACSRINFERRVCYIIMPEQTADGSQPWLLAHEREHCAGKDHVGESDLARGWEKWKEKEAIRVWQSPR
jgi:hypothetical protein